MSTIPKEDIVNIRVSTVLNRDVKNYGKQHMLDDSPDTCWNSDEGKNQWVSLEFGQPYRVTGFAIEFQGGFVGKDCHAIISMDDETYSEPFYPEDANGCQNFTLSQPRSSKSLRFSFNDSTDFFGRIVIYAVKVYGECVKGT